MNALGPFILVVRGTNCLKQFLMMFSPDYFTSVHKWSGGSFGLSIRLSKMVDMNYLFLDHLCGDSTKHSLISWWNNMSNFGHLAPAS